MTRRGPRTPKIHAAMKEGLEAFIQAVMQYKGQKRVSPLWNVYMESERKLR